MGVDWYAGVTLPLLQAQVQVAEVVDYVTVSRDKVEMGQKGGTGFERIYIVPAIIRK